MAAFTKRFLGSTGLEVGALGVAASYGAPAEAFEEAFEKGCNYFYLGSGRHKAGMRRAIRSICRKGNRDRLVIAIQTYARFGFLMEGVFKRRLRSLGLERADILVLGWHNRAPSPGLVARAQQVKAKGLCRFLAMSGHQRKLFPQMAAKGQFDLFHVRYNAAHRGAEQDIFPHLQGDDRPGIVSYTATRWAQLLNAKKMPPEDTVAQASDCYRFALSCPDVDVCMTGPANVDQMREALAALAEGPLSAEESERFRRIGRHLRSNHKRVIFEQG